MREIINLRVLSPFDCDARKLITDLDTYQNQLYPEASNHLDSLQDLSNHNCKLIGAYKKNSLVGIGAAKILDGYGELKRFFVLPSSRGQGVAECIISVLEKWLMGNDISISRLETGVHQTAAIYFYKKLGYEPVDPFGSYTPDPLSIFMEKNLQLETEGKANNSKQYYLVAFSSRLNEISPEYLDLSSQMNSLAKRQTGFLGVSSTRNRTGEGFTVSYWKDLRSISVWKSNPLHMEAQKLGKNKFYKKYQISTAVMHEAF